ncbi:hypothetical protein FOL47_000097 [Perkinsus chesapeaki]|uniref:Uncharacterized protein n=1 Tax=Perkinsus chesapeaki TaxID=330153 RepID=A0A7J6N475_PERCH|nr:hypothetical protein FOL47_000097 [Perkinsus chesapeaki]
MEFNAAANEVTEGFQETSKGVKIRPICGPVDPKVEETASERICRLRGLISNRKGSSRVALSKPGRPLLSFDKLRDEADKEDENDEGLVVEFIDRRRKSCGRNTLRKFLDRSKALPVFTVPRRPLAANDEAPTAVRQQMPAGRIEATPAEATGAKGLHSSIVMQPSEEPRRGEYCHEEDRMEGAKRCEAPEKRDRLRLRRSTSEPDLAVRRSSAGSEDIAAAEECNSEPEDFIRKSNRKRKVRKRKRNRFVDDAASESGSNISGDEDEEVDGDGYLSDLIATDVESDASDCDPRFLHRQWEEDMGDRMLRGIFGRGFGEGSMDTFNPNRKVQVIMKENKERLLNAANRQASTVTEPKEGGNAVHSRASPLVNKSLKRVSLGMRDEACELNLKRTVGFVRRRSSRGRPAGVFLSGGLTHEVAVRQRSTRFVSTTSVKSQHGVRRFIFGA